MPILCERFTTSKLKAFEDLTSIGTYGFRGEALASISHIAHLQVTTKTKESSCAWRAHYSTGKLVPAKPGQSSDPSACAGRQGTQITVSSNGPEDTLPSTDVFLKVEDLFYNVPTRRRAFRSASEEYAKILDLVGRYAVHCSNVAFSCKKHGDSSLGIAVQASATTQDRIRTIHGSSVANELIRLEAANDRWGFKAEGWVTNANYHVKKMILLLFINHRAVESSTIKKAVERTYSAFLPKGGHPFVYLSLEIEPQRVDVNVHPTKREVNFLNEDEIIEIICDEIRARLGKVDTSRTFVTQRLLPGASIPTISMPTISTASENTAPDTPESATQRRTATQRTPATKPYENNLVRTDSRVRKITSMLPPAMRVQSSPTRHNEDIDMLDAISNSDQPPELLTSGSLEYTTLPREHAPCRLTTVKELRATVRSAMHGGLTDVITAHTFVGVVDCRRRIAAVQSGVKLFLVDYGLLCNEYFYQVGLTDFGNFGTIRLDPPLSLSALLDIGAGEEAQSTDANDEELDWPAAAAAVHAALLSRRDMLAEYFRLEISEDGFLLSLPLLIKGYTPSMTKLPRFLLRLGPYVDWADEKECFRSFLRELAAWYTPEVLPPPPAKQGDAEAPEKTEATQTTPPVTAAESPAVAERRREVYRALEHVLFPAFRARLVATKGMLTGVVEIANLKGLYKVFERC